MRYQSYEKSLKVRKIFSNYALEVCDLEIALHNSWFVEG